MQEDFILKESNEKLILIWLYQAIRVESFKKSLNYLIEFKKFFPHLDSNPRSHLVYKSIDFLKLKGTKNQKFVSGGIWTHASIHWPEHTHCY